MSTPRATTLPEVCGATSVCSSPARLPVASKNLGSSRVIAAAVVTSTALGEGAVSGESFLTFAFEPPQETARLIALIRSRTKPANRYVLGDNMTYLFLAEPSAGQGLRPFFFDEFL